MSGYKHALVTVQPREIERMHFAEPYLRAPRENPVELVENVRQESIVQVWNGISAVERRQQDYQKALTQMGKMVRGWESHLNRRLFEHEEQLAGAMQACAGRLASQLDQSSGREISATRICSRRNRPSANHRWRAWPGG